MFVFSRNFQSRQDISMQVKGFSAAAVKAGAGNVMVSFSSWNGTRLHAHQYLLTGVLKGELGFEGFLISDW